MYTTNKKAAYHLSLPGMVAILMGIGFALWIVLQVVLPILTAMAKVGSALQ
jgi:hypothetical protein